MNVAELIAALSKMPQDAVALVGRYNGNFVEYVAVEGVHEERDAKYREVFEAMNGKAVVID